jgi:hypothetical protein
VPRQPFHLVMQMAKRARRLAKNLAREPSWRNEEMSRGFPFRFGRKHNLIPMRSNHTRETGHFITLLTASPAKDAGKLFISFLS